MNNKLLKYFMIFIFVVSFISFIVVFVLNHTVVLNGDKYVTIGLNDRYEEEGATNSFNGSSKHISINGHVDNTKVGTYRIEYKSKIFGYEMKKYRYVDVIDKEAPFIELEGSDEIVLCPVGQYKEDGFKAYDTYDGDITSKVERIEKKDSITYSVLDSSGNSYTKIRNLKRVDRESPSLKLKGNDTMYVLLDSEFVDPGYTVNDNCDKDITVKVSGSVDTSKEGTYELVYKASDSSNNTTSLKRYIKVRKRSTADNNIGVIFLTFDDGPSSTATPKILDILDKKDVKATFFVINHDSSLDYLIKRAYDSGHTIALHSYTHNYAKIYASKENYYADLKLISDKVEKITGEKSMIMRFPGGGSNTVSRKYQKGIMSELTKEVIEKGYRYYDWNVSSGDAGGAKNSDDVYNNVVKGLQKNRNNIVLMHDFSNSKTVGALEAIIDYGLANGYIFDKIDMTTPMVRHGVNN